MAKLTRQTPPENLIRYVTTADRYDIVQKLVIKRNPTWRSKL